MSASVKKRQQLERKIARRVILDGKKQGFLFNVDNGGDDYELPKPTDNTKLLLSTMFATDDELLYVFKPNQDKPFGWVRFVYGNDGYDAVQDHTTNLEEMMAGANTLADKLADNL